MDGNTIDVLMQANHKETAQNCGLKTLKDYMISRQRFMLNCYYRPFWVTTLALILVSHFIATKSARIRINLHFIHFSRGYGLIQRLFNFSINLKHHCYVVGLNSFGKNIINFKTQAASNLMRCLYDDELCSLELCVGEVLYNFIAR